MTEVSDTLEVGTARAPAEHLGSETTKSAVGESPSGPMRIKDDAGFRDISIVRVTEPGSVRIISDLVGALRGPALSETGRYCEA
jgi:hypothetical protein